jgi:hypothetical protein
MRRFPHGTLLHGVIVMALVLSVSVAAQRGTELGRFTALTFALSIPHRQFLVLEPIPITMRLENRTNRGVLGHGVLEFSAGRVDLFIQPEGLTPYRVDQLSAVTELVGIKPAVIPPGAARQITEVLEVDLDKILPRPGQYQIQALLTGVNPGEVLQSNKVSLVLREPDALEHAAQAYIKSTPSASYFFTVLAEEQHLEEAAAAFNGTIFSDYAYLRLGENSAARRDHETARAYLTKVASRSGFPLAKRVAARLADLKEK